MVDWLRIIQETLLITSFVVVVMLLIEFVNVTTEGKIINRFSKNRFLQILTGTLLGLLPGCLGVFTAVSLYTHRILSFGALLAAMIATTGDEAYFMIALMPKQTIIIFSVLAVLSVVIGMLADKIFKNKNFAGKKNFSFDLHHHDLTEAKGKSFSVKNFSFKPKRLSIIGIIMTVIVLTVLGIIGHSHSESLIFSLPDINTNKKIEMPSHQHSDKEVDCNHDLNPSIDHEKDTHSHENHKHSFDWVKITILISSFFALIVVLFSTNHFIETHLWKHIIVKHLPKIFLWVFLTLVAIAFLLKYAEFDTWIYNNLFYVLIIAILVGIIPQSGPHLVFVVLFIQGTIPLSILLANSIVQNGHGSLPLFAESKKSFVIMKIILIFLGFLAGISGILFNF
ncbi:MAG: putative manganese transporter [Bacteroidales bacterium]|nr:putative manganese transporter [Bacteroidales bacterium]